MYLQVDYNLDGNHYVEKFLILEQDEEDGVEVHIVSGLYGGDFNARKAAWSIWLMKVKDLSEGC